MEFANRDSCVTHYMGLYPHLPKYIVEIALDYDLNKVKPTGKQKRALNAQRQRNVEAREDDHDAYNPETAVRIVKREDLDDDGITVGSIVVDEMPQNVQELKSNYIEEDKNE